MKHTILVAAVLLVILIAGCQVSETTPTQRVALFLEDINVAAPDYPSIQQAHFSSTMADYENLDTATYWVATFFDYVASGTITTADLVRTDNADGTVTLTGTIAGSLVDSYPVTFTLVSAGDGMFVIDWLISYILVEDSGSPVPIQRVR